MKTNKKYESPVISAEIMESSDVITSSPASFDLFDNWKSDNFLPLNDQI